MSRERDLERARQKRDGLVFGLTFLFHLLACFCSGYAGKDHFAERAFCIFLVWVSGLFPVLVLPSRADERRPYPVIAGIACLSRLAVLSGCLLIQGMVSGRIFWLMPALMVVDLLAVRAVFLLLRQRRCDVRWTLAFALNPLSVMIFQQAVENEMGVLTLLYTLSLLILVWAVSVQRLSWFIFSVTLACHGAGAAVFHPAAVTLLWFPFTLVFWIEVLFFLQRRKVRRETPMVRDVSVIVPARNEEHRIGVCIRAMVSSSFVREIIVVDGGSEDRTKEIAEAHGARVIVHDALPENGGGRGGQIKRGIAAACGDVVAVVHADTTVDPSVFRQVLEVLAVNPRIVGGAAGTVFDDLSPGMKAVEFLNALRAVCFKISFGDQIQFFRRKEVADYDLFPDVPLMEDVEFSLRLQGLGQTVYLFGTSTVSARRWRDRGFQNALTVLGCFFSYLVQRLWKTPDTLAFYRRYYGQISGRDS
jgi:GT2 family glycosyltransferase